MWKIRGKVYDLTNFLDIHPGGRNILESSEGLDNLTELFNRYHTNVDKTKLKEIMNKYEIHSSRNDFIYHIIGLIYSLSILTYFILTIIFLSQDYSIYETCPESHVWYYVLVGMIFLVPLFLIKKMYIILIIEFPLMIWGMTELFQHDKCVELITSHVWNIGLATCIIEMLVCFGIIISYIYPRSADERPNVTVPTPTPSLRRETEI
jgi:hypothetical protein